MAWYWFGKKERSVGTRGDRSLSELRGAPPHARTKTYSAETGHVYQYVFRGYRPVSVPPARDYVFDVRRSRDVTIPISIRLQNTALAACAERAGRPLLDAENYAVAKMTLFAGLDEVTDLAASTMPWTPEAGTMIAHLETLGRL